MLHCTRDCPEILKTFAPLNWAMGKKIKTNNNSNNETNTDTNAGAHSDQGYLLGKKSLHPQMSCILCKKKKPRKTTKKI